MNLENNERYEEYLQILAQDPGCRRMFDDTCRMYEQQEHRAMPMDHQLYLMTFAPVLIGFVGWVLRQAHQSGKKRLYFLSRDGYQMYQIACRMTEIKKIPITCKYLHVSRYAMRVPGYHLDLEQSIDSICVGGIDVTLFKILRRGGLTESQICDVIHELHLEEHSEQILNYRQVMQLREQLRDSQTLKNAIAQHSKAAYTDAIGYLKQEGLCEDDEFAIVDSGWIGTLQCSIEKLIQSVNPDIKVEGYYFGMYELPRGAHADRFHAYYFSAKSGIAAKASFSNSLFETIVSSDEGMTIGYRYNGGRYEPILDQSCNPNAKQMKENARVLQMFLEQLRQEDVCIEKYSFYRNLCRQLLELFMAHPTILECQCYGNNLFSDDVLDGCHKEVAARLSLEQIHDQRLLHKLLIVSGIKRATIYESAWLEGSAVRAVWENTQLTDKTKKRRLSSELRHIRWYKSIVYIKKQMKPL